MARAARRLFAAAALLAAAAALAVVVLGRDDGGDGSAGRDHPRAGAAAGSAPARPAAAATAAEVRNASPQPSWQPRSGPVPIFRFHVVGEAGAEEPTPELFVPPADFSAQMEWLDDHGYEAVGLETVEAAWSEGGTLPAKPVVLSFDGVRGELMSTVLPELRRRGWPAVLVLDPRGAAAVAPQVRALVATGWELEPEASGPEAAADDLGARFGAPARNLAFPPGELDEAAGPGLEAAGFRGATATGGGFAEADQPFAMPRITIFGLSGVDGFAEAIRSRGEGVGA